MAKSERRQAIAPIVDDIDVTEEIREINNPLLQPEKKEEIDRYTIPDGRSHERGPDQGNFRGNAG